MGQGLQSETSIVQPITRLIRNKEARVIFEVKKLIDPKNDETNFDSQIARELVETALDLLVEAIVKINEQKNMFENESEVDLQELDILAGIIEALDQAGYLDNVNLEYYRANKPGEIQYMSAKDLLSSLLSMTDAASHTFNIRGDLKVNPDPKHQQFESSFCNLLILEAQANSSKLGHQAVFIPQYSGDPINADFVEKKYYSFRIDN